MRIILSSNPYRDRGLRGALEAKKVLDRAGAQTVVCLPFVPKKSDQLELPSYMKLCDLERELPQADLLICFGGDGTILHASRDAARHGVPILGVNLGSVGFMAELERSELSRLVEVVKQPLRLEERMMLRIRHMRGDGLLMEDFALNDAVFSKNLNARVADMEIWVDDTLATVLTGDGAIIATPTGSTGYSLSAGGPIVEPTSKELIISPVCAHRLGARAMILGSDRKVTIRIPRGSRKILSLAVDGGRPVRIANGERVEITRAEQVTRLVRLTDRNFYQIVNQKLGGFSR